MMYVVYRINEIDCDSCLNFLISKLEKYKIKVDIYCGKCHTLTIQLNSESEIQKVSKIISDAGYENQFEYIGQDKNHQHS